MVRPRGAHLGPHMCVGSWECLGECLPKQARWFSLVLTRDAVPWERRAVQGNRGSRVVRLVAVLDDLLA